MLEERKKQEYECFNKYILGWEIITSLTPKFPTQVLPSSQEQSMPKKSLPAFSLAYTHFHIRDDGSYCSCSTEKLTIIKSTFSPCGYISSKSFTSSSN